MDFLTAFMIGFLGSMHCIGMCGPIALALPLDRSSVGKQVMGVSLYNAGRIFTYALVGLIFGLIGQNVALFGYQQYFSIGLGVLVILMALLPYSMENLFGLTPGLQRALNQLKKSMGFYLKKHRWSSLLGIGLLNGLLPCGLVYFAVVGALASYSPAGGAQFMIVFGLGTLPMMVLAAISPGFVGIQWRNRIRRALPYFAIVIGVMFILRGMNLGLPYLSPQLNPEQPDAVECHEEGGVGAIFSPFRPSL